MALCCVCTLCQDASRVTADQYKGAAGGQQRVHRGGGGGRAGQACPAAGRDATDGCGLVVDHCLGCR